MVPSRSAKFANICHMKLVLTCGHFFTYSLNDNMENKWEGTFPNKMKKLGNNQTIITYD